MKTTHLWRSILVMPITVVALGAMVGCGAADGTSRYHISGKVTFGGKPLPIGHIVFEPDASQNNFGPQGFAEISKGQYSTRASGKGHVGGQHVVRIEGFDGQVIDPDYFPHGTPLFPTYTTTIGLPSDVSTLDVEIPAAPPQ